MDKKRPQNVCAYCGNDTFNIRYVETAWARVGADGEDREEGYDVEGIYTEWETARCRQCEKPHKWIDTEEI